MSYQNNQMYHTKYILRATILLLFSMLSTMQSWAGGTNDPITSGVKTGYYTYIYARESTNDMPRKFHLLIEKSGEITLFGYDRYSNDNSAEYSKLTFDPDQFLGKTVTVDYTGGIHTNNKEFNITLADGSLKRIAKIRIYTINSMTLSGERVKVDKQYQYPNTDTLLMPHPVQIEASEYHFTPQATNVSLLDFVDRGEGTSDSPYVSDDGSSGLLRAIDALGGSGTIVVDRGVYQISTNRIKLPVGVNIKGQGEEQSRFIFLKAGATWILQGDNRIEHVGIDISHINHYSHTIMVDNNARNVTFSNVTLDGAYSVDPVTYLSRGYVVGIGLASYITNVTLDGCKFHNVFRGLQSKGQRNHQGITVRNCLFDGFSYTPISLDQTSDITDVVIEDNEFRDFCHFGVAFARISNVSLRNNLFFSRQQVSPDAFNQAIHLEDHSNRFVIEGNTIDVILRRPERDSYRNAAISVSDGRIIKIRNNVIYNSSITLQSGETSLAGYSQIEGNSIDDGFIYIGEATAVEISHNSITNAPSSPIVISTGEAMQHPVSGIVVRENVISDFSGCAAFSILAFASDIRIVDNFISGDNIQKAHISVSHSPESIVFSGNIFRGGN